MDQVISGQSMLKLNPPERVMRSVKQPEHIILQTLYIWRANSLEAMIGEIGLFPFFEAAKNWDCDKYYCKRVQRG